MFVVLLSVDDTLRDEDFLAFFSREKRRMVNAFAGRGWDLEGRRSSGLDSEVEAEVEVDSEDWTFDLVMDLRGDIPFFPFCFDLLFFLFLCFPGAVFSARCWLAFSFSF